MEVRNYMRQHEQQQVMFLEIPYVSMEVRNSIRQHGSKKFHTSAWKAILILFNITKLHISAWIKLSEFVKKFHMLQRT
jgi:hypothetical protein